MPDASPVTLHHEGWRCTITLNRPERHNAFDAEVIAQLTQAFAQAAELADTRVVVLAARGSTFCAGADLRWMKAMALQTPAQNVADAEALAALARPLPHYGKQSWLLFQGAQAVEKGIWPPLAERVRVLAPAGR